MSSPLIVSPDQVIVVDDDSHDETEHVARDFGANYVRVACHNVSGSRNAGFASVRTQYVTFLDDDDAWLPGNMEPQLVALQTHPGAAFAYGITRCASEDLEPLPWTYPSAPLASGIVPEQLHLGYPHLGVVLFRRDAIAGVGGFDLGVPYYGDGDLMLRIAARHEIVGVDFVGMLHRYRAPTKARDDYYWVNRKVTNWRPKDAGIGWKTTAKYMFDRRRLFFGRFTEDAAACAVAGRPLQALVCLSRALWISPPHTLRHVRTIRSILSDAFKQDRKLSAGHLL